ncbi:unnamed protein product [Candida verbasci]|uniref:ARID domain-containing protein n=1 Tax=Candida verbasci TaxID=1227364 RepID=A0A9W4TYY0_9ASCO|nr:unnamed protein product [Candida verbasci]
MNWDMNENKSLSNDDFLNSIFDQNQGQQQQSQPQPPPQQQQPMVQPSPMQQPLQGNPEQMFMKNQQQQQQPTNFNKQEQLYRMKQQIYQQKMLQKQQQQQQQQNISSRPSPMNSSVPTPLPQQGTPLMNQQPNPIQQPMHQPPQQQMKPTPNQTQTQMQMELFLTLLYDFLHRRGVAVNQPFTINGKRINLFVFHFICQRLGGFQQLKKFTQFTPQSQHPWTLIGSKLGVFDGITDSNAKDRIDREICNCYTTYLLPYEEYSSTPQGARELTQRRAQFQPQIIQKYQALANANTNTPPIQQVQSPINQPIPPRKTSQHPNSQLNSPYVPPSRATSVTDMNSRQPSQASMRQTPIMPQQPQPQPQPQPQVTMKAEISKEEANILKNYVPFKKLIETYGNYPIKDLSQIAGEIEVTKPVYLFAPELGIINLQALTMSLKSNHGIQDSEVVNALNTLLVTTSDVNYTFHIKDSLELLDALSILGKQILNKIVGETPKEEVKIKPESKIDEIFNKYVTSRGEDIALVVNSLTGEVEDDDMDEIFSIDEPETPETPPQIEETIDHFYLDDYLTALQNFRKENKYHFSKLQTRSAMNDQILLVDELITVTMILRNISFSEANKEYLARNDLFKDLLFSIVKQIGLHYDEFVFSRKRLGLLKDCLLMLDNIAFYIQLKSLEEAFLSFALVASFGPKIHGDFQIPKCDLDTHSYLSFGVDALTKLLVREPYNRSLLQAVLNGTLNISLTTAHSNSAFQISLHDQEYTRKLIKAYLGKENKAVLLTRAFQILMSFIPYNANSFEFSKFIFVRAPTISQMFFGVKLLMDMAPIDDLTNHLNELTLNWMLQNRELLLGNFARIVVALSSETGKFPRESNEHKVLSSVLRKGLIVVNTLVENALKAKEIAETEDRHSKLMEKLTDCYAFPRIIPDINLTLDTLLTPSIDTSLGKEVVRLLRYLRDLKAYEGI